MRSSLSNFRLAWPCAAAALALLLCLGCGRTNPTYVSGQVNLNGNPPMWGTVTFHPVAGQMPIHGKIDSRGFYRLRSSQSEAIPLGEYIVTVKAFSRMPTEQMSAAEINALLITPKRYHNKETSGLPFSVGSGDNTIDIQLTTD